ncbi:MAG: hypothetical protein LBU27_03385 [Candidatus Peribacteria bacterium]|jgi:hypothetical protein|nr:hypothetical protein [Candidatus Peribacteria bacterium]
MNKKIVSWEEYRQSSPLPHYVDSTENLVVIYNDKEIRISGKCLFPSSDPTLKPREHANHFHVVMLIDVVETLNVLWNASRVAKSFLGFSQMLSIETNSRITEKFVLDTSYRFEVQATKGTHDFWNVELKIYNSDGKVIATVECKAYCPRPQD